MEFMLDTAVNIVDEVLQKELSQRSDQRMQTIVATIQRDQNAIIRNAESSVLVIQGVAGSGKTSIALHRVAYLLYRFKDSLSSDDILIISPNRVFADYIANVLPELGEETHRRAGDGAPGRGAARAPYQASRPSSSRRRCSPSSRMRR